jgi:uncharacterized protein
MTIHRRRGASKISAVRSVVPLNGISSGLAKARSETGRKMTSGRRNRVRRRAHARPFDRSDLDLTCAAQAKATNGGTAMARDLAREDGNKALVQASFDRWKNAAGGPFELLDDNVEWTIVGSSPLARTYRNKQEFIDTVIAPFNARMAQPLVPMVRGIYADGDTVIILFDAEATVIDGKPYRNSYTWYFQMKDEKVAFFDNRHFDEFWNRVSPKA